MDAEVWPCRHPLNVFAVEAKVGWIVLFPKVQIFSLFDIKHDVPCFTVLFCSREKLLEPIQ